MQQSFKDKYHFRNYIRKIFITLYETDNVNNNSFEYFSKYFYTMYEVASKYSSFFYYLQFDLCLQIANEVRNLNSQDYAYAYTLLTTEYPQLVKELLKISDLLENQNVDKNSSSNFGIDITKFPIFYKYACEQNKFLQIFLNGTILTNEFKEFINCIERKKGLYFLYDKNETLIYIGKSINLGIRMLASIRERGAYFISICETLTKSEMHIYETYYILKEKPLLNKQFSETDKLSVELPELIKSKKILVYVQK